MTADLEMPAIPGAWEQFEHAVDAAVESGPKHRIVPKRPKAKMIA